MYPFAGTIQAGVTGAYSYVSEGVMGALEDASTMTDDFGEGVTAVDFHRYWNRYCVDSLD